MAMFADPSFNVFKNSMGVALKVLATQKAAAVNKSKALAEEEAQQAAAKADRLQVLKESMEKNIRPVVYFETVTGNDVPFLWEDLVELGYAENEGKYHYLKESAPCGVEIVMEKYTGNILTEGDFIDGETLEPGEKFHSSKGVISESRVLEVDVDSEKERNMIIQIREAMDIKRPIVFRDGNTLILSKDELGKINTMYEAIEKPVNKVAFLEEISATPVALIKYI